MLSVEIPTSVQTISSDYVGYVYVSDIDKTYLATQIDSLRGLLRAAFETAERKENVPGFSVLLRALRRGGDLNPKRCPLYFLSASPPQLATRLLEKMKIDRIEHDGIIFKNQLTYIRRAKFRKLKEQIGYKLLALLRLWKKLPSDCKMVLFGDDSESDSIVYSLFVEILANNVRGKELFELLRGLDVFREEALQVAWLSRSLGPARYPVQAAYINLATGTHPSFYARFGSYIYASDHALQTALSVYERGLIRVQALRSIAKELLVLEDWDEDSLSESLIAGARRGLYAIDTLRSVWSDLAEVGALGVQPSWESREGEFSRLDPRRWGSDSIRSNLFELKQRYDSEERYFPSPET